MNQFASENPLLRTDLAGLSRCWWGSTPEIYRAYHDDEWGRPTKDDFRLFEKICLEGFQSGLSWLTILKKRENFRKAFQGFDYTKVASYGEKEVDALLQDAGIIRHQGKIRASINNAQQAIGIAKEFGSLASYIWQWEPTTRETHAGKGEYTFAIPSETQTSQALSKDLKKRGWRFFGPTTAYAFMQAMGMVNDHVPGCHCYAQVEAERKAFDRPQ